MNSQFSRLFTILTFMPVITQPISQHVTSWTNARTANGTSITQTFYLCFGFKIPKMHAAIRSCSHKPTILEWIETNRVYGVEEGLIANFFLITLEGNL